MIKPNNFAEVGHIMRMIHSRYNGREIIAEMKNNPPLFDESFRQYTDRLSTVTNKALWEIMESVLHLYSEATGNVVAMVAIRELLKRSRDGVPVRDM